MTIKKVGVVGGAGFVGSSIVAKLDAAGYQVKVLTRNRERARHLILLPHVQVETCDVSNIETLLASLKGCDAVINLSGILHEGKNSTFEFVHHELPRRIAKACVDLGIKRLVHMSALQASESAPSQYLKSKARGEAALSGFHKVIDITIFKPSVIFGRGDRFLNLFASLVKFLPIIFLAKPSAKFQPIWVENVADIFVNSVQDDRTYGKSYELGGPAIYSMQDLVEKVMQVLNITRPIVGLSDKFSYLQAWVMEWSPVNLITRDNVRSMEVESVAKEALATEISIPLMPLEAVMPEYISNKTPRAAYLQFRTAAGRVINARR